MIDVFYFDEDWVVFTDNLRDTFEHAVDQARFEFENVSLALRDEVLTPPSQRHGRTCRRSTRS